MGLMQRNKGKRFERAIASILRARFPDATVRRASQADRPHQSDVYIVGGPPVLERLWCECQDSRHPTPIAKLEQAERDSQGWNDRHRLPIAITHQLGARTIYVTTRLWVLDVLRAQYFNRNKQAVTMELGEFLGVVADAKEGKGA